MLIKCEGKVKPSICFCIQYVFRLCLCFVFIVYSYLLNCIVPLMSMKFPVKHTEDKSFYLSAKIFLRKKKKNTLSSQSVV